MANLSPQCIGVARLVLGSDNRRDLIAGQLPAAVQKAVIMPASAAFAHRFGGFGKQPPLCLGRRQDLALDLIRDSVA
jgi:hypothetical protein